MLGTFRFLYWLSAPGSPAWVWTRLIVAGPPAFIAFLVLLAAFHPVSLLGNILTGVLAALPGVYVAERYERSLGL